MKNISNYGSVKTSYGSENNAGLTLIEVLIALAIGSVVLTALYSSFSLTHTATAGLDNTLVNLQEVRNFTDSLRREIESAYFVKGKEYTLFRIEDREVFGSTFSRLTFTAFSQLRPGLSRLEYLVETEGEAHAILKKIGSAYSGEDGGDRVVMLENIRSFSVEALFDDKWVKTWDSELAGKAPEAIKITLAIGKEGEGDGFAVTDTANIRIGRPL